jgi:acylphosphatase
VRVKGLVQGVSFRVETADRARARGVAGWVRNLPDGDVEAVFEGERDQVGALVAWCRRGPRAARVERVDVAWEEPVGERGFVVR